VIENRIRSNEITPIYSFQKLVENVYNSIRYFFVRNIQGDISHIVDGEGNIQAKYVYDAWGNCKVFNSYGEEDIDGSTIGNINPFRYRGYYYDTETGLYYLNARYYDPQTCRFISADTLSILDETMAQVNGLNLYMYCNNNPVMDVDPSGN
jgi:RHS repeat-associated protein